MIAETEIKKISVSDYYKMAEAGLFHPDEKVELLDGIIYLKYPNQNFQSIESNMSPVKSRHAGVVNRLSRLMNKSLIEKALVIVQNPIKLDDFSEPEPDVIIAKLSDDDYMNQHPKSNDILLLIEVSDSTLKRDKTKKMRAYAKSNIAEYWVINLVDNCMEVYKKPNGKKYKSHQIFEKDTVVRFDLFDLEFEVKTILGTDYL